MRDTGIGIAPDEQARIFREFEQADGGATRKSAAPASALRSRKRIVERMGGRIARRERARRRRDCSSSRVALPRAPMRLRRTAFAAPDLAGSAVLIVAPVAIEASLIARRLDALGRAGRGRPTSQRRARAPAGARMGRGR